ncbi:alpha/beta hydrolase [Thalassotalea loyana]|uniref:Alpha/beta hydrolase n=1 Tax=Thalassotalea loyana TaxID=280483 RepID=A0ABQ6HF93_9GAMM|nr:alpha/beta family hydrolase [Thalassotalea loyana]GLX86772.1 alpha/beta hydrolase [Thalassotalea loyana]
MNRLLINESSKAIATFVFAHGAGAGMSHTFMENMTSKLNRLGINTVRFDFPYMAKRAVDGKKYPPNKMPILIEAYKEVVENLSSTLPVFIGGKSMGSRVAMTLLSEHKSMAEQVKGAICLGYPFHPPKKPDNLRLSPLTDNKVPTLICQGERDTLGNKREVLSYQLDTNYSVKFFPDGDHDFKPRVRSGFTHEENLDEVAIAILAFVKAQLESHG